MTGYNDRSDMRPSMGSILSKARGTTHADTGMPTYVKVGNIRSDGPGWLGPRYSALTPSGQARKNLDLSVTLDRSTERRGLLGGIDKLRRDLDTSGTMEGLDGFEQQAFDLVTGSSVEAFDVKKEDAKTTDGKKTEGGEGKSDAKGKSDTKTSTSSDSKSSSSSSTKSSSGKND